MKMEVVVDPGEQWMGGAGVDFIGGRLRCVRRQCAEPIKECNRGRCLLKVIVKKMDEEKTAEE